MGHKAGIIWRLKETLQHPLSGWYVCSIPMSCPSTIYLKHLMARLQAHADSLELLEIGY